MPAEPPGAHARLLAEVTTLVATHSPAELAQRIIRLRRAPREAIGKDPWLVEAVERPPGA